ncbi:hypothetical protein NUW54_g11829 [Trametes sanguinea]|uniref:Uncharacterized protein n=1 Tax=Trametes sanguinea TaxID=158606 RepID=A0ACC1N8N2_9APHY|nr:hypothetical protein NUW54_g11829 [Trametes sanguinea]
MSVYPDPLISYAYGDALWAADPAEKGPDSQNLDWYVVHVAIAELAPQTHGVVASLIVTTQSGINRCAFNSTPVISIRLTCYTYIDIGENTRTVTLRDTATVPWAIHHLRFRSRGDFWDCVYALAEAKGQVEARRKEIDVSLRKVIDTFPVVTRPQPDNVGSSDADDYESDGSTIGKEGFAASNDVGAVDGSV